MNSIIGELRSELALAVLIEKEKSSKLDKEQAVDLINNVQFILNSMVDKEMLIKKEAKTLTEEQSF
jgi:hypothetical protein